MKSWLENNPGGPNVQAPSGLLGLTAKELTFQGQSGRTFYIVLKSLDAAGNESVPSVHPGAPELCRGCVDGDRDGAVDCHDSDCPSASGPGEVIPFRWSEGTWVWESVAGAEVYDLARGLISDWKRRQDLALSDCVGKSLTAAQWTDDGRRPPVGDALGYLIRAEGMPCTRSGWGDGVELRKTPACR